MTEPTITCPSCTTEIRLTESLAAPLIKATREQFEQQLAEQNAAIAQREHARLIAEESRKAKAAAALELEQQVRELADLQEKYPD